MHVSGVLRIFAAALVLGLMPAVRGDDRPGALATGGRATEWVDVKLRHIEWIKPGTQIADGPPKGWSHLVMVAKPRLGAGDVDSVPRIAAHYASMFSFAIVANVRPETNNDADQPRFFLERVAIGIATNVQGRNLIVTSEQTMGADIGLIGRAVMQENDRILRNDMYQVARTRTMMVFDVNSPMRRNTQHTRMVIRHAILITPETGRLTTFVWLLARAGADQYVLAENVVQMLPPGMHEDRVLSVDANKFTLGIPSADAFALARVPQGTPIKFSESLAALAALRRFTPETTLKLEAEFRTRYAPLALRVNPARATVR
jgi:hypothetical protein